MVPRASENGEKNIISKCVQQFPNFGLGNVKASLPNKIVGGTRERRQCCLKSFNVISCVFDVISLSVW